MSENYDEMLDFISTICDDDEQLPETEDVLRSSPKISERPPLSSKEKAKRMVGASMHRSYIEQRVLAKAYRISRRRHKSLSAAYNEQARLERVERERHLEREVVKRRRRRHPIRSLLLRLAALAACIFMVVWGLSLWILSGVQYEKVDVAWPDEPAAQVAAMPLVSAEKVDTILLLGTDARTDSYSRSDTMMLVGITESGQIRMASILRDTWVDIPGHGESRINHACAYGGPSLAMRTVESNFRIKTRRYISIDMEGAAAVVDAFGGVTLELSEAEAAHINESLGCSLASGSVHLSGQQAIFYARIRKLDSDFARTQRQRKLLAAMLEQCASISQVELLLKIQQCGQYVTTNLTNAQILSLAAKVAGCSDEQKSVSMRIPIDESYHNSTIDGMQVLVPELEANCAALSEFIYA